MSLEGWFKLANVVYLAAVGAAAIASFGLYSLGTRISATKDRELERFRLEAQKEIADSKERTAQAELQLEGLRIRSWPRASTFDLPAFLAVLKDQPKTDVEIWYAPNDFEAYDLASRISTALHFAGWSAPLPVPVPIAETREGSFTASQPPLARVGGQYGVSLVGRTMPWGPLMRAIGEATKLSGGNVGAFGNPDMPEGVVRVIVGVKP